MMKPAHLSAAFVAALLSSTLMAKTIVTVDGTKIDDSDISRRAKIFVTNSKGQIQDGPELRNAILNELITEVLVTQEAKRLKLDKSADYEKAKAESLKEIKEKGLDRDKNFKQNWADYQNHLLLNIYAVHLFKQNPVRPEQVKQRYQQLQSFYQNSHEVQLGEIYTDKPAQTQAALKELGAKKKFTDVARKYSINPNVKQTSGIVEDYIPLNDLKEMNPNVHNAVANLNKGQYTPTPLKDGNLNLILYVNDKRKVTLPTFEKVKEGIEYDIQNEQLREAIDALGKKAKIVPTE